MKLAEILAWVYLVAELSKRRLMRLRRSITAASKQFRKVMIRSKGEGPCEGSFPPSSICGGNPRGGNKRMKLELIQFMVIGAHQLIHFKRKKRVSVL